MAQHTTSDSTESSSQSAGTRATTRTRTSFGGGAYVAPTIFSSTLAPGDSVLVSPHSRHSHQSRSSHNSKRLVHSHNSRNSRNSRWSYRSCRSNDDQGSRIVFTKFGKKGIKLMGKLRKEYGRSKKASDAPAKSFPRVCTIWSYSNFEYSRLLLTEFFCVFVRCKKTKKTT